MLVVGAGASYEAKLPLGSELKKHIAGLLDIRYEFYSRVSGDEIIDRSFGLLARAENRVDINPCLYASGRIRDAMPQAISIDNFIDAHRSDSLVAQCGKLAIARSILLAESKSPLLIKPGNVYNRLNFKALENTWFNPFFQVLTEYCQRVDLPERFSRVAVVCFNYDRCIEHYLFNALQNYYGMNPDDTASALSALEIYHPYGMVGNLPWSGSRDGIAFGETPSAGQLINLARQIRTFTEGADEQIVPNPKSVGLLDADKLLRARRQRIFLQAVDSCQDPVAGLIGKLSQFLLGGLLPLDPKGGHRASVQQRNPHVE